MGTQHRRPLNLGPWHLNPETARSHDQTMTASVDSEAAWKAALLSLQAPARVWPGPYEAQPFFGTKATLSHFPSACTAPDSGATSTSGSKSSGMCLTIAGVNHDGLSRTQDAYRLRTQARTSSRSGAQRASFVWKRFVALTSSFPAATENRRACAWAAPSPGADVGGASAVRGQTWKLMTAYRVLRTGLERPERRAVLTLDTQQQADER
jgi:hypothetical protein